MNHRILATSIGILCFATIAGAEPAAKPTTQPDSPKQALRAQDAAAKAGDMEADLGFYQAEGDQQKKLAHVIAEGDVALAKLESAVDAKFGKELAAAVVRAAGSEALPAIDAATEKVDGDHATIQFQDQTSPVPMLRSEGKWKISLSDWVQGATPAQIDQLIASIQKLAGETVHLRELVEKDKFRSGEGVRDRVQGLHDQLFGPAGR